MFTKWLRTNNYAAGILTILRLYLGWGFLTAGWEKITGPKAFDAAGFLANAIKHPVLGPEKDILYPVFSGFLKSFALPNVRLFDFLVPWGEFFVGLGLILGTLTTAAVFFGMVMNFAYLFAGTVSTNPLDILMGIFIIVAGFNAGRFGVDYWLIPYLRNVEHEAFHGGLKFGGHRKAHI